MSTVNNTQEKIEKKIDHKIDVIIPVYNNIQVTLDCIRSLYKHLSSHINNIILHDDCSDTDTKKILQQISNHSNKNCEILGQNIKPYNLKVIRSDSNIGFAAGVNKACQLAKSEYLFILNSDTEIKSDIISPMINILECSPHIAAINPSGSVYKHKKLKYCKKSSLIDCQQNTQPYIYSTNLSGYALLISKDMFNKMGQFNTLYGRGYFEDTELSRVIINNGYSMAIYPTHDIVHIGQSSFKQIKSNSDNFAKELMQKNQKLYYSRFPEAKQQLDIYTLKSDFNKLSQDTKDNIINLVKAGATVTIHSLLSPKNLPYFQIKFKRLKLRDLIRHYGLLLENL